jgi:hypothetical protein
LTKSSPPRRSALAPQELGTRGRPWTLIRNIATLVTGDIRRPLVDADSILIEGGRIAHVGARCRRRRGHRRQGLDRHPA